MGKSGAVVVAAIEKWILSYMAMPADLAFVVALWTIHTWVYEKFGVTPYVSITGDGPGVGKSKLMTLIELLSRGAMKTTATTPAALLRSIGEDGKVTILVDEAETMSREGQTLIGQLVNSGYEEGDVIRRAKPGSATETVDYRSFCPKVFAGIGSLRGTLRSRSIEIMMTAGTAPRDFYRMDAKQEAQALTGMIQGLVAGTNWKRLAASHLVEREREIWTPLFSVAASIGADVERLTAISSDLSAEKKTTEKRRVEQHRETTGERIDREYAPRALADLRRVFVEGEDKLPSETAVERMKALADGPWRKYRGDGLTALGLSGLVARYGVSPVLFSMKGRKVRGYRAGQVSKAVAE